MQSQQQSQHRNVTRIQQRPPQQQAVQPSPAASPPPVSQAPVQGSNSTRAGPGGHKANSGSTSSATSAPQTVPTILPRPAQQQQQQQNARVADNRKGAASDQGSVQGSAAAVSSQQQQGKGQADHRRVRGMIRYPPGTALSNSKGNTGGDAAANSQQQADAEYSGKGSNQPPSSSAAAVTGTAAMGAVDSPTWRTDGADGGAVPPLSLMSRMPRFMAPSLDQGKHDTKEREEEVDNWEAYGTSPPKMPNSDLAFLMRSGNGQQSGSGGPMSSAGSTDLSNSLSRLRPPSAAPSIASSIASSATAGTGGDADMLDADSALTKELERDIAREAAAFQGDVATSSTGMQNGLLIRESSMPAKFNGGGSSNYDSDAYPTSVNADPNPLSSVYPDRSGTPSRNDPGHHHHQSAGHAHHHHSHVTSHGHHQPHSISLSAATGVQSLMPQPSPPNSATGGLGGSWRPKPGFGPGAGRTFNSDADPDPNDGRPRPAPLQRASSLPGVGVRSPGYTASPPQSPGSPYTLLPGAVTGAQTGSPAFIPAGASATPGTKAALGMTMSSRARASYRESRQGHPGHAPSGSFSARGKLSFGGDQLSSDPKADWDDYTPDGAAHSLSESTTPREPAAPGQTSVQMLNLLYDPPVENCELKPYISLRDVSGKTFAVDNAREELVQYRWYRGQKRVCSVTKCNNGAFLQCLSCIKAGLPVHFSWFCSDACLISAWPTHRQMHAAAATRQKEAQMKAQQSGPKGALNNGNKFKPTEWHFDDFCWLEPHKGINVQPSTPSSVLSPTFMSLNGSAAGNTSAVVQQQQQQLQYLHGLADTALSSDPDAVAAVHCKFPAQVGNMWQEICRTRFFTPSSNDVGRALRFEVSPVLSSLQDKQNPMQLGKWVGIETTAVMPMPAHAQPRHITYTDHPPNISGQPFRVQCYNVLADIYASPSLYSYCPPWALSWDYRKQQLLREILMNDADIVCLQEVQADHYEQFFQRELFKVGYDGIYRRKNRDTESPSIDGCATFYKRDRFALVEQYVIDYDELARANSTRNPRVLRRLLKGNIALAAVLEELTLSEPKNRPPHLRGLARKRRRLCVTNTHIFWDPEYPDVKLWQTWMLSTELEKIVLRRNVPLVICGDFNSMSRSAVYELLSSKRVRPEHPVFKNDPYEVLPPVPNIVHRLPLASAYGLIGEPKYTNYTGHFVGVLDYVWFTKNSLAPISLLEVDEEESLKTHTALPNPQHASDHVSLVVNFDWVEE